MSLSPLKSCVVGVRLSDDQYAPFAPLMQEAGLKPAPYFRQLVLSRSPKILHSQMDLDRLGQCYAKASQTINQVAHQANAAPYKGVVNQSLYVAWLRRLMTTKTLLHLALPETSPPIRPRRAGVQSKKGDKTRCINFRLTPEELEPFADMMRRANCSSSTFFRELILNGEPEFKEYTGFRRKLLFLFNKSANNTAQLARVGKAAFSRGLIEEDLFTQWLKTLSDIETILLMGMDYAD